MKLSFRFKRGRKARIPGLERAFYLPSSEFAERIFSHVYDRLTVYSSSETRIQTTSKYIGFLDTFVESLRRGKYTSSYACKTYAYYTIHFGLFDIGLYIGSRKRFYIKLGRN